MQLARVGAQEAASRVGLAEPALHQQPAERARQTQLPREAVGGGVVGDGREHPAASGEQGGHPPSVAAAPDGTQAAVRHRADAWDGVPYSRPNR